MTAVDVEANVIARSGSSHNAIANDGWSDYRHTRFDQKAVVVAVIAAAAYDVCKVESTTNESE